MIATKEASAAAFNGACDLTLINAATKMQSQGLGGIPQDCWIATAVRKLFEFSSVFGYINVFGQAGQFAISLMNQEQAVSADWLLVNEWQREATQKRISRSGPGPEQLLTPVQRAIGRISKFYDVA